jgi:hypothetical protein
MPNTAHTSLPDFTSGLLNPESWVNQMNGILAFASIQQEVKKVQILSGFTPVIGTIYLVASGSVSPYTPGTVVIWLNPLNPPQGFNPSSGTVVGGWTKNIAGNDWVNNSMADMRNESTFITSPSTPTTYILPNLFEGKMTLAHYGSSTVTINGASGRSSNGKIALPLNAGCYTIYQDANIALI